MKQRNINLDLIRCLAVLFVISVHFCLNSGFYDLPCSGIRMLFMCILRTVFITCVPLFLMLTGYLMNEKELSLSYYKGIKRTYIIYVLICICCLLFRVHYEHEAISLNQMILSIFDFSADSYAWYIEMYIGLFLLIPFLNIIWGHIGDKNKKWLILTLLAITALPSLINCWYILPSQSEHPAYGAIVPDYWEMLYPITYYFLGAYLKELKKRRGLLRESLLLMGIMILFGGFNYWRSYGGNYEWISYNSFQGVQAVIVSFLIFRVVMAFPMENCPDIVKKAISKVSKLSLGIYLASAISDRIVYPLLLEKVADEVKRLDYFPVTILESFVIALIISLAANFIYDAVKTVLNLAKHKMSRKSIQNSI